MSKSTSVITFVADRLPCLLLKTDELVSAKMQEYQQLYGRETLKEALFQHRLLPIIMANAQALVAIADAIQEVASCWDKLGEDGKAYWESKYAMLLDGSKWPLGAEIMQDFLHTQASQLVAQFQQSRERLVLLDLSVPKSSDEAIMINQLPDSIARLVSALDVHTADHIRLFSGRVLFEYHATALKKVADLSVRSPLDLKLFMNHAWVSASDLRRQWWQYQTLQLLSALQQRNLNVLDHLDTSLSTELSQSYAANAMHDLKSAPTISRLTDIAGDTAPPNFKSSSDRPQDTMSSPRLQERATRTSASSYATETYTDTRPYKKLTQLTVLVGQVHGRMQSKTVANKICAAIRNRRVEHPDMEVDGRYCGMRLTFDPTARDVTSIWHKVCVNRSGCVSDNRYRNLERLCSASHQNTVRKILEWARQRAAIVNSKHDLLKARAKCRPGSKLALMLEEFGLTENRTGFARKLWRCFERDGLSADEYADRIETTLYTLKYHHPELFESHGKGPLPRSESSFSSTGFAFEPTAPSFQPGVPQLHQPVNKPSSIFGNVEIPDIVKPARRSKAVAIVRPDQFSRKSLEPESDFEKKEGRIAQSDDRFGPLPWQRESGRLTHR